MVKTGIDIIQINRISLDDNFIKKVLHEKEIELLNSKNNDDEKKQFLAGRWAAKESIYKAHKHSLGYNKINIYLDQDQLNVESDLNVSISISISHEKEYAVAMALVE